MSGKRRFGTVRRLASGRWQVRYNAQDGVRRLAPTTFETKRDADRWLVTTEAEMNTANNIGRRMNQGACFPLYVTPGMDISEEVLAYLNQSVASAPTTYTPPAGH